MSDPDRRVAAPKTTSSTPLAMGSRVPQWPTRFSPRMLRTAFTAWKEVMPGGLMRLMTPDSMVLHDPAGGGEELASGPVEGRFQLASGSVLMAAPAEFLRQPADVDSAPGTQARLHDPGSRLADQNGDEDRGDFQAVIHDLLRVLVVGAASFEIPPGERREGDAALRRYLQDGEDAAQEP